MRPTTTKIPDLKGGIDYWNTQPASLDGVLGGYGSGTLPRVDALGSRQFLLSLLPELSIISSSFKRQIDGSTQRTRRTRAAEVGAGIGRVTSTVLLYIMEDVVLLEPVDKFIEEAYSSASHSDTSEKWKGLADKSTGATFLQGTLQDFDPASPMQGSNTRLLGRLGYKPDPPSDQDESGFDVIWCQWCLGHLSDADLVSFFKRSQKSLRSKARGTGDLNGLIIVKENLCAEEVIGHPRTVFDEDDSSLTRSDSAWKKLFVEAGLRIVSEQVQHGFPEGLYVVKMYALR